MKLYWFDIYVLFDQDFNPRGTKEYLCEEEFARKGAKTQSVAAFPLRLSAFAG